MPAKRRRENRMSSDSGLIEDDNFDLESVLIKISDHVKKEKEAFDKSRETLVLPD